MDFKKEIAAALAPLCSMEEGEIASWFETPPDPAMGDYAFPCFRLAKTLRKAPPLIANDIASNIALPAFVAKAEAVGGYVNFTLSASQYAKAVLTSVFENGENYGGSDEGNKRNVCIDYSSINIAKPFHIGHLSSTAIGHSLYRIFKHMGYNPVGINHLGDWGTQFGKLIVAYKLWGDEKEIEENSVRALLSLYVRYHDEAEKNPALDDEARAWFKRIEDGDEEAVNFLEWFKSITLREVGKVYSMLDIEFDSYAGESFYNDKMDRGINELREKKLLKLDKGAHIVDLEEYGMSPCIILRSDGATLYATRDIAAAFYRKDTYDFAKSLYVVAYQQDLHFKQVFKSIELLGYDWVKDMVHVSFGMVSMAEGTLSTRKGKIVFLEDVLKAAIEKTRAIMEEKSPNLQNKDEVAKEVGVGAVVWNALYNNRIKDVVFSYDKALNFDGETGPYVQYTHARCCSVLRKAEYSPVDASKIDFDAFESEASRGVIRALNAFPNAVRDAMEKYEPYLISRAVVALCQAYNKFYFEERIMGVEENVQTARLALTDATKRVIKTGLYLVGLKAPESM